MKHPVLSMCADVATDGVMPEKAIIRSGLAPSCRMPGGSAKNSMHERGTPAPAEHPEMLHGISMDHTRSETLHGISITDMLNPRCCMTFGRNTL